ncbi:hypothetical protein AB0G74_22135 [Streptomyces sp. NPDC020875]|uniref:hypothetical protein n=1 Tax=Streptomyces sp. NPDC020875 TaxID=3154898 RepID=UPI0033F5CCBC
MIIDPISQSDKHLARIGRFVRTAADIMLEFDSDPAQEQTPGGWPCDELAYSWAAHRRDCSMWEAFRPVEECLDSVLATANSQLDRLPTASRGEWQSRIDAFTRAAETLDAEHLRAVARLRDHLVRDNADIATVGHILTEFYDEAWPALDTLAGSARSIIELNAAVNPPSTAQRQRGDTRSAARRSSGGAIPTPPVPGQGPARRGDHRWPRP